MSARIRSILPAALLLAAVAPAMAFLYRAPASPVVTEFTRYYQVRGASIRDLIKQMRALGPMDPHKRHFDAFTDWRVKWSYSHRRLANACAMGPVRVDLAIRYTYPAWKRTGESPAELTEKWQSYVAALRTHEKGHRSIAERSARAILDVLSTLGPRATCEALDRAANAEANRLWAAAREEEARYDRRTGHGLTQGALLK